MARILKNVNADGGDRHDTGQAGRFRPAGGGVRGRAVGGVPAPHDGFPARDGTARPEFAAGLELRKINPGKPQR
ncbi:hypothetical protein J2S90_001578 [Arthrobacter bambusae]|uniref:Uncharacterized protein n=1 Tax=Arthrobacter bambusae TaxID=1338426 RepID=A0AAW8DIH6_9MICC|nr:hypothetical protein [Arthrobacter bambusae]MDQ0129439.1 hypothetical protein [Arthrobacter bambusae]MDQ0180948.1 hypothetical protein [Arthrobacter bambusae]